MPRNRERKPSKRMKQVFLVFCEGDTEECYVQELRQRYRAPIEIKPVRRGQAITNDFVRREIENTKISRGDNIETFLMYDFDVPAVNAKLSKCPGINICSNPCVELWFLLHSQDQTCALRSDICVEALQKSSSEWNSYRKVRLSNLQKDLLWNNRAEAMRRAKSLRTPGNPSTEVYKLLESIEQSLQQ